MHLRNAPTAMMKRLGYGAGYRYPHDAPGHHVPVDYLPDELRGRHYYQPSDQGLEARIGERVRHLREQVAAARESAGKRPSSRRSRPAAKAPSEPTSDTQGEPSAENSEKDSD